MRQFEHSILFFFISNSLQFVIDNMYLSRTFILIDTERGWFSDIRDRLAIDEDESEKTATSGAPRLNDGPGGVFNEGQKGRLPPAARFKNIS
jgi:hypothetical protein